MRPEMILELGHGLEGRRRAVLPQTPLLNILRSPVLLCVPRRVPVKVLRLREIVLVGAVAPEAAEGVEQVRDDVALGLVEQAGGDPGVADDGLTLTKSKHC